MTTAWESEFCFKFLLCWRAWECYYHCKLLQTQSVGPYARDGYKTTILFPRCDILGTLSVSTGCFYRFKSVNVLRALWSLLESLLSVPCGRYTRCGTRELTYERRITQSIRDIYGQIWQVKTKHIEPRVVGFMNVWNAQELTDSSGTSRHRFTHAGGVIARKVQFATWVVRIMNQKRAYR